jgi:hypothetical protein
MFYEAGLTYPRGAFQQYGQLLFIGGGKKRLLIPYGDVIRLDHSG